MKTVFLRSLWGVPLSDWESYFPQLKEQGIIGIEASLSDVGAFSDNGTRFLDLIESLQMSWICGLYSGWIDYIGEPEEKSVDEHLACLKKQIETLNGLCIQPIHVNIHAGSDSFSREESIAFFKGSSNLTSSLKMPFSYETHRGRILYSPWVALDLLQNAKLDNLYFTLDLSHWIVVVERLIPMEKIDLVLARTRHIHARIGTPQSSQVSNPARMDVDIRNYFESIWNRVLYHQKQLGANRSTMCLEYGPSDEGGYQPLVCSASDAADGGGLVWRTELPLNVLIEQEAKRLRNAGF